jgi:hypothetical protein
MNDLTIVVLLALSLSGLLLWLLIPRNPSSQTTATQIPSTVNEVLAAAKHYGYFPQIRQALSVEDTKYLRETAPRHVAKQALRERRAVALRFLEGLHEDFSHLARLGRVIAALSPEISRQQETERLILSLKFQMLYALVWLRLSSGSLPLEQLEHLTGLVGRLATRMNEAISEISAQSLGQLSRSVDA